MRTTAVLVAILTVLATTAALLVAVPAPSAHAAAHIMRTATTTSTTTSPDLNPDRNCEIRIANRWPGGFLIEIILRNTGPIPISSWTVQFTLLPGMRVQQVWNAMVTQTNLTVTATPLPWNQLIPPGGSITIGIVIAGDPTGWTPPPC
jgi:cellulase/cellobiase CelA1